MIMVYPGSECWGEDGNVLDATREEYYTGVMLMLDRVTDTYSPFTNLTDEGDNVEEDCVEAGAYMWPADDYFNSDEYQLLYAYEKLSEIWEMVLEETTPKC